MLCCTNQVVRQVHTLVAEYTMSNMKLMSRCSHNAWVDERSICIILLCHSRAIATNSMLYTNSNASNYAT